MKKGGKTEGILVTLIIVVLAANIIVILHMFVSNIPITGGAILQVQTPTACSDANIRAIWDAVFKETSSGTIIYNNSYESGKCNTFRAYKKNGGILYILEGADVTPSFKFKVITAIKGNFTNQYISMIEGIVNGTYNSESTEFSNYQASFYDLAVLIPYLQSPRTISSTTEANTEFNSIFEQLPEVTGWKEDTSYSQTKVYTFIENSTSGNSEYNNGVVFGDYNYSFFQYISFNKTQSIDVSLNCQPSWVLMNNKCDSDEKIINIYNDNNFCGVPNKETKDTSTNCDYGGNKIIGKLDDLVRINIELLKLEIADKNFNESSSYSSVQKVEIISGNDTFVEFSWNFTTPLNLRDITVRKQSGSSEDGYIIVNGINIKKTVWIDKLINSSNKVCIKNSEVTSISSVSDNCDDDDEYLISCPNSNNTEFTCSVSGNKFIVSGINKSAIVEFIGNGSVIINASICNPNWSCTNWSGCTGTIQTRICNDTKNCGTNSGKPAGNQSCTCTPNWVCTELQPKDCPKNKTQTQTCNDSNNCGTIAGKPEEVKKCTIEKNLGWLFWVITIFVFMVLIATAVYLALTLIKKEPMYS